MTRKIMFLSLVLALALSSCTFVLNMPTPYPVGPTQVDEISLPIPYQEGTVQLTLSFGAGTLNLNPGSGSLVSGTASYNVEDFKPVITSDGLTASIEQGNWKMKNIPNVEDLKNQWDLSLGSVPLDLIVEAGAYKGEFELGGLALENLTIKDGASDVKVDFSQPNTTEMSMFRYETGASNVRLDGLVNAKFSFMEFDSGAGNYTLDFTGVLSREANVSIETGVSNFTLVIPADMQAEITVEGGLSFVDFGTGWEKNGNVYTQDGSGPKLTIIVEIGAGNLVLTR